ncbi:MAG: DNA cytosine methyltransferase [Terrimicrobiaceae bacterium]
MRPVAVDLFAGAGGMSLGFEQAGFDVRAAVEIDPIHSCVHHFNFPRCTVIPRSVKELDGQDIRRLAGIIGKVHVVCGGAPCQGFSMIGKRVLDDPRNSLVRDYVRIVSELEADYFVFENVRGLTVGDHRKFLEELIGEFEERGYEVRLPWLVLNAVDYGVPQDRKRLFLLGARRGKKLPVYPPYLTTRAGSVPEMGVPGGPSCSDALGDLPDAATFQSLLSSDEVRTSAWGNPSGYARELRCLEPSAWHFGHPRLWDPEMLTSSARSEHTDISQARFASTQPGEVEPISRFFKLPPLGVSNTLRAGTDASRGAFTSPRPIHYKYPRCVTVREMARLHGFPDWFRFHVTKWHGARQIGNSVPPPLARAVAGAIIRAMVIAPSRLAMPLPLGDPALLRLEMSQASAYWGVECPIQTRDRKSGARKRSQSETEACRLAAA